MAIKQDEIHAAKNRKFLQVRMLTAYESNHRKRFEKNGKENASDLSEAFFIYSAGLSSVVFFA